MTGRDNERIAAFEGHDYLTLLPVMRLDVPIRGQSLQMFRLGGRPWTNTLVGIEVHREVSIERRLQPVRGVPVATKDPGTLGIRKTSDSPWQLAAHARLKVHPRIGFDLAIPFTKRVIVHHHLPVRHVFAGRERRTGSRLRLTKRFGLCPASPRMTVRPWTAGVPPALVRLPIYATITGKGGDSPPAYSFGDLAHHAGSSGRGTARSAAAMPSIS